MLEAVKVVLASLLAVCLAVGFLYLILKVSLETVSYVWSVCRGLVQGIQQWRRGEDE